MKNQKTILILAGVAAAATGLYYMNKKKAATAKTEAAAVTAPAAVTAVLGPETTIKNPIKLSLQHMISDPKVDSGFAATATVKGLTLQNMSKTA